MIHHRRATLKRRLPAHEIPAELMNPRSDLGVVIDTVAAMREGDSPLQQAFIRKTHSLLKLACPQFRPSRIDPLLCRSGEDNGQPYRVLACHKCQVGQFSESGFVGEILAAAPSRESQQSQQ